MQSKPGLYARIVVRAVFELRAIVSHVSPGCTVYLFVQGMFGYGVNPTLAKHNCWPGWRAEQVIGLFKAMNVGKLIPYYVIL